MKGNKKKSAGRGESPGGKLMIPALVLATALYFLTVCLCSASTIKVTALTLAVLALSSAFLFFSKLRDRMGCPLLLLFTFIAMGGISTLYAVAGKFALYEFLKDLAGLCLVLLLLALAPSDRPDRWIATVLAGFTALAGLVSIDMISTRLLSGPVLSFLGLFSGDYSNLPGVETGVRMTSMFENPNVFAGLTGLGVLLSLGLVSSAGSRERRCAHTALLYVNSLSFLLAFSMGASGSIAVAFVVFLLLERGDRRGGDLILMVETLIFTVLSAAVISVTSFDIWSGVRPVPLICTVIGAAALCLSDMYLGERLAELLKKRGKLLPAVAAAAVALVIIFGIAAYNLTGGVSLKAGEGLRRAAYPDPGTYVLSTECDGPLSVSIESQNQQDTMMHTSSVLYSGAADGAEFTVPEGSLVVYFNLSAPEGSDVRTVTFTGENGSGDLPLGYKLLPGFMANRLQGLWANENAIQRLVFFSDGLKLCRRSPVVGLGMGAFENGIKSVQSFAYVTRYAHNHYIQTLAETGIVGLVLLVALFLGSGAAVLKERRRGETANPLTPALGAAVVFMAVHAATEVVFSAYPYIPVAFGVFALVSLCCGESFPKLTLKKTAKTVSLLVTCGFILIYSVLLVFNLHARAVAEGGRTFDSLEQAVKMDKFEWADYALSYVNSATQTEAGPDILAKADKYAARLETRDSNTIPIYLAEYYFATGRTGKALEMVEKHVDYVSSDQAAWQRAFDLLIANEKYTDEFRAGVLRIAGRFNAWNAENMGQIKLSDEAMALIARAGG